MNVSIPENVVTPQYERKPIRWMRLATWHIFWETVFLSW